MAVAKPNPWRRFVGRQGGFQKDQASPLWALTAWIVALIVFFPVFYIVITGFKPEPQAVDLPPRLIPWPGYASAQEAVFDEETTDIEGADAEAIAEASEGRFEVRFDPTLFQYEQVFRLRFGPFFQNSIIASLASTSLVLIMGIPAAYALSIRAGPRSKNALFFFISTKFLPPAGVVVPLLIIYRNVGLIGTIQGLILLYTAMNLPIAIWMLRSFFVEVPKDVIDAARVDGANVLQEIWQVLVPIIMPGIVATAFISVIFAWNEFFFAVTLASAGTSTVPMFMVRFVTSEGLFWAKLSASVTMGALPVILLGWIAQRQLVRGLSLGAVK